MNELLSPESRCLVPMSVRIGFVFDLWAFYYCYMLYVGSIHSAAKWSIVKISINYEITHGPIKIVCVRLTFFSLCISTFVYVFLPMGSQINE